MKNLLVFILIPSLFFTACEHFDRRKQIESHSQLESEGTPIKEGRNKNKIRELEKKISTRQERQMYSKLLPWFLSDEERINFLSQSTFEDKQEWIQTSGILGRQGTLTQKYKKLIDSQDIAIGMPNEIVKKSWGDPFEVEVSGNPLYKNEKWKYLRSISSAEGFRQEKRIIYFENGKVVGWETE